MTLVQEAKKRSLLIFFVNVQVLAVASVAPACSSPMETTEACLVFLPG